MSIERDSHVESLPTKQKHLIGVGAAIAVGCQPCTTAYVAAAKSEGACDRGVRFAIEQGLEGRKSAAAALSAFADSSFPNPELDSAFRAERELLGALIAVAAGVASSTATTLKSAIAAARAQGATDNQLRIAVTIAQTTKRGADDAVAATLSAELGIVTTTSRPDAVAGAEHQCACAPSAQ